MREELVEKVVDDLTASTYGHPLQFHDAREMFLFLISQLQALNYVIIPKHVSVDSYSSDVLKTVVAQSIGGANTIDKDDVNAEEILRQLQYYGWVIIPAQ